MATYDEGFYQDIDASARRSAAVVAPLVDRLLHPKRVVDVGCGLGSWAAAFAALGVAEVWGVDGPTVDPALVQVDDGHFVTADLSQPLRLGRGFDLAIALEVAEHLPPASADVFVESLCGLAPAVMFSAAIPGQGGVHHVNEQWPQYWAERFEARGYVAIDCIRRYVWSNEDVAWWYAQNTLLYVSAETLACSAALQDEHRLTSRGQLAVVHPSRYLDAVALRLVGPEIERVVPPDAPLIFVGYGEIADGLLAGRTVLPFLERDGLPWGQPADDRQAIAELDRMRREGARYLAFSRPSFWWLEHYAGFARHLAAEHQRIVANEVLVLYELSPSPPIVG